MRINPPLLQTGQRRNRSSEGVTAAQRIRASFADNLRDRQLRAAQRQILLPFAVGQEAEMPDVDKAGGQNVEEKAANELDGFQGHRLGLVASGIVLPLEGDSTILHP